MRRCDVPEYFLFYFNAEKTIYKSKPKRAPQRRNVAHRWSLRTKSRSRGDEFWQVEAQ